MQSTIDLASLHQIVDDVIRECENHSEGAELKVSARLAQIIQMRLINMGLRTVVQRGFALYHRRLLRRFYNRENRLLTVAERAAMEEHLGEICRRHSWCRCGDYVIDVIPNFIIETERTLHNFRWFVIIANVEKERKKKTAIYLPD